GLTRRIKVEFDRLAVEEEKQWESNGCITNTGKPAARPKARKVQQRLVADVSHALASMSILPGSIRCPSWIEEGPEPFPADEVLACRNGLVHLPSIIDGKRARLQPTPRFFSPNVLEYDFNPSAPAPGEWLRFLGQLWPDDPQSVETLAEWFGYCLT